MLCDPIGKLPHGTKVVIKTTDRAWAYPCNSKNTEKVIFNPRKFYVGYVDREAGLWIQIEHVEGSPTRMGKSILILPYYDIALCIKYVGDKK